MVGRAKSINIQGYKPKKVTSDVLPRKIVGKMCSANCGGRGNILFAIL